MFKIYRSCKKIININYIDSLNILQLDGQGELDELRTMAEVCINLDFYHLYRIRIFETIWLISTNCIVTVETSPEGTARSKRTTEDIH